MVQVIMPLCSQALIGDVGGAELMVVLAAILMLFGGKKLPSIARTFGKTVSDLRRASQDFRSQLLNADQERDGPFEGPSPFAPVKGLTPPPPVPDGPVAADLAPDHPHDAPPPAPGEQPAAATDQAVAHAPQEPRHRDLAG